MGLRCAMILFFFFKPILMGFFLIPSRQQQIVWSQRGHEDHLLHPHILVLSSQRRYGKHIFLDCAEIAHRYPLRLTPFCTCMSWVGVAGWRNWRCIGYIMTKVRNAVMGQKSPITGWKWSGEDGGGERATLGAHNENYFDESIPIWGSEANAIHSTVFSRRNVYRQHLFPAARPRFFLYV